MFQLMENEKHRWFYMTEEQLARRLKKITIPAKLDCFIDMAGMRGNDYLYQLAEERRIDLGMIAKAKLTSTHNGVIKIMRENAEKWNKKKEKEIDERYLEF